MEILLLGIYSAFVWLIFIKLKWLPWNTTSQVTVAIIPIVALTVLILTLNAVAPSSADVRVYKYTIPVVSLVRGRVVEVGVEEGNRLVKKGDMLFRIDPTPYQFTVNTLEAQLANTQGSMRDLEEQQKGAEAKIAEATARTREVSAKLELTRRRVLQYTELAKTGAGNRFDLERAEADQREQEGQLAGARSSEAAARAGERQVQQKLGAKVGGDYAQVAQVRAQLAQARWELEQTTMYSPCDCYVINLQLRPGSFVGQVALASVMTLVEAEGQVVALYYQNELHQVKPGDEAEFALDTMPGRIIKAKVDSIVWAQGQGQLTPSGIIPMSGYAPQPPGRYAVKFNIEERDKALFLAAGAAGHAAIYTERAEEIHILRKVILRVGSYLNYIIPKLH